MTVPIHTLTEETENIAYIVSKQTDSQSHKLTYRNSTSIYTPRHAWMSPEAQTDQHFLDMYSLECFLVC